MCGASSQQTQTYNEQQQFFQQLMTQSDQAWNQDQDVLAAIKAVSAPIFAAGPSQEGFAPQEKAALETQATESTAQNYAKAATAVNSKLAAQGGGNLYIPSGATAQIQVQTAQSAAQELSREQGQITQADWQQGYNQWLEAGKNMFGVSQQLNPANFASVASGAGGQAASTANQIAQESNSWINAAIGAAGAVGAGALGNSAGLSHIWSGQQG